MLHLGKQNQWDLVKETLTNINFVWNLNEDLFPWKNGNFLHHEVICAGRFDVLELLINRGLDVFLMQNKDINSKSVYQLAFEINPNAMRQLIIKNPKLASQLSPSLILFAIKDLLILPNGIEIDLILNFLKQLKHPKYGGNEVNDEKSTVPDKTIHNKFALLLSNSHQFEILVKLIKVYPHLLDLDVSNHSFFGYYHRSNFKENEKTYCNLLSQIVEIIKANAPKYDTKTLNYFLLHLAMDKQWELLATTLVYINHTWDLNALQCRSISDDYLQHLVVLDEQFSILELLMTRGIDLNLCQDKRSATQKSAFQLGCEINPNKMRELVLKFPQFSRQLHAKQIFSLLKDLLKIGDLGGIMKFLEELDHPLYGINKQVLNDEKSIIKSAPTFDRLTSMLAEAQELDYFFRVLHIDKAGSHNYTFEHCCATIPNQVRQHLLAYPALVKSLTAQQTFLVIKDLLNSSDDDQSAAIQFLEKLPHPVYGVSCPQDDKSMLGEELAGFSKFALLLAESEEVTILLKVLKSYLVKVDIQNPYTKKYLFELITPEFFAKFYLINEYFDMIKLLAENIKSNSPLYNEVSLNKFLFFLAERKFWDFLEDLLTSLPNFKLHYNFVTPSGDKLQDLVIANGQYSILEQLLVRGMSMQDCGPKTKASLELAYKNNPEQMKTIATRLPNLAKMLLPTQQPITDQKAQGDEVNAASRNAFRTLTTSQQTVTSMIVASPQTFSSSQNQQAQLPAVKTTLDEKNQPLKMTQNTIQTQASGDQGLPLSRMT